MIINNKRMNMTAALIDEYAPYTRAIAQACAITFQGNASNGLQQDAFFFLDHWYQEELGGDAYDISASAVLLSSIRRCRQL